MTPPVRRPPDLDALERGVRAGDRTALGQAITLVESRRPEHRRAARELLARLTPGPADGVRVGLSGVPGVGKSTLIETLGGQLTAAGRRVAVLAVDPTSERSGGSILGDKTRMTALSQNPDAFIRPSPAGDALGGVTRATRETMLLCEAAGFDVVLVETVGVGQSEHVLADMVDVFVVLALPGAGDELQGIKRGILEHADLIAVNKADAEDDARAVQTARDHLAALAYMRPAAPGWTPPVLRVSGLTGRGLDALWAEVERFQTQMRAAGEWQAKRRRQAVRWMWSIVEDELLAALRADPALRAAAPRLEDEVLAGRRTPDDAAREALAVFRREREGQGG